MDTFLTFPLSWRLCCTKFKATLSLLPKTSCKTIVISIDAVWLGVRCSAELKMASIYLVFGYYHIVGQAYALYGKIVIIHQNLFSYSNMVDEGSQKTLPWVAPSTHIASYKFKVHHSLNNEYSITWLRVFTDTFPTSSTCLKVCPLKYQLEF